jgi:hypothetical protein
MVLNATFKNISVILWQSALMALLVEETGIPEKIMDLSHLSHNVVSSTPRLSGVRTQVNPTTIRSLSQRPCINLVSAASPLTFKHTALDKNKADT